MDFIVLVIVNRICRYAATCLRILISTTFGALWSVIVVLIPVNIKWFVDICTYVLVSYIMIKICAGKGEFKDVIKGVGALYAITLTLGGAIHVLYYYTYAGWIIKHIVVRDKELLVFVVVSVILIGLIYVQLIKIKTYASCKCRLCCVINGKKIEMTGYIDSGNVLVDPIFHKPVSVAERTYFDDILNKINDYTKVKYHVIPFSSLGCEQGIMEIITVDIMYIYYGKKTRTIKKALVGLTRGKLSTDGEYAVLVNSAYTDSNLCK